MSDIDYSKLQVGIVGAGLMGRWHAMTALRLGATLVSVVDQDLSRAESLSKELGDSADIFSGIDDLLKDSKPDIVHICTPLDSHYPIALQLIDAGIHVIVEKPLANSAIDTRALLQAADRQGVKICPVHQFGFQDGVLKAMAKLSSLGELLSVRFTTASAGGMTQDKDTWNNIVADIIPHPLSVLQRLCTGINLDTRLWQAVQGRRGELQLLGDAGGIAIDIYISLNARPTRCEMELYCSGGRIYLNFFHGYLVIEKGRESRLQKALQPLKYTFKEFFLAAGNMTKRGWQKEFAYPGLSRLMNDFYQAVVSASKAPISAEDVLAIAAARDDLAGRFLRDPPPHDTQ